MGVGLYLSVVFLSVFVFGLVQRCGLWPPCGSGGLSNRGFLNGPLCPIYGLGVVAIDFFLRPFGSSLPVQLVGAMLLGSVLEYAAGFLLEKLFHQKWWDYSDTPHNLHGYICLKFSVVWGLAGA